MTGDQMDTPPEDLERLVAELDRARRERELQATTAAAPAPAPPTPPPVLPAVEAERGQPHALDPDPASRYRRRSSGRRRTARRARWRHRLGRSAVILLGVVTLGAVGWFVAGLFGGGITPDVPPTETPGGPVVDRQATALVAIYDGDDPNSDASVAFLLAHHGEQEQGIILLVPTATVADVPGYGLEALGRAFGFGRGPLLEASIENLLGVGIDTTVEVSEDGWASVFTRLGEVTVDLPERLIERLPDGTAVVRFEAGEQVLDGPQVAEVLTFIGEDENDLDRQSRVQRVLNALLDALAEDDAALDALFVDGAPMFETTAPGDSLRELLASLTAARTSEQLRVLTLPVRPVGSGEAGSYRVDTERMRDVIAQHFADSVPEGHGADGRRLQVLNGNGRPGVGHDVAQLLLPAGFSVVLTGNANTFDHEITRVVVYTDDAAHLAAAEQVVDLLGVGVVERSATPQSVVDITIVVGRDFLARFGPQPSGVGTSPLPTAETTSS